MTIEELLNPRYKVIAPYPNSKYRMGEIINYTDQSGSVTSDTFCQFYDKYPHLFKKLFWYEEGDEKDMPEFVKFLGSDIIWKIKKWDYRWFNTPIPEKKEENGESFSISHHFHKQKMLPATREEYEKYLQSKK